MLSRVVPFRRKPALVGWCPDELAECYRVVGLLARSGLPVSIDSGLTDEGEPWAIVLREDTGDVLLHMARLNGAFVVVSAAGTVAQRGESLRAVLDTAVQTGGLAMLTRHSAAADCEILRLHPATLIAAFIAAAWVHTQASQAELLAAGARREEGSPSRTPDEAARMAGFAALTPSAALVTVATSFAAVAAVLHASHTDPILEVTLEDFIETALELVAGAPIIATPVIATLVEFANLELRQDGPLISLATMDGSASLPSEAQLNDSPVLVHLEASASLAPMPMISASARDISGFLVQQQSGTQSPGLNWDAAEARFLAIGMVDTVVFASAGPAGQLLVATSSSSPPASPSVEGTAFNARPAAQMQAPTHSTMLAESATVVRTTLPVTMHETSLHSAHSLDARGVIFKSTAQILHVDRAVTLTGSEASGFLDKNSEGATAVLGPKPAPVSVTADTGSTQPNTTNSVVSQAPPAQGAALPVAESATVVRTTLPVTMHETSLHSAHSWDARGVIFKSTAQILHVVRAMAPTGTETSGFPDKNSEGAAALGAKPASASVLTDTGSALPSTTNSVVSPAPPAQGAALPQAAPSDSNVGAASRPLTAAVQPAPPSNAQILLEFTNRTDHVVRVDRDALAGPLTGPLAGHLETGNARKVVVFDAPWLDKKSFMLMPGVMMMEDDLLGGVNRAGLEMKASPVSLDLGGGLTLTLLGVMDLGLT